MIHRRSAPSMPDVGLLTAVLTASLTLSSAAAKSPSTLFNWRYGCGGDGGADLNEPLVSDRPDFTESPSVVGRGVVQIESGYTYSYDDDATGSTKVHSMPEALFRIGILAEWLELRIFYNYAEETTHLFGVSRTLDTGSEDLGLGLKFALTGQEGLFPETGFIVQVTVPSGSAVFSAGETLAGVNYIYGWELNDLISTAAQTQVNRALDDVTGEPYAEFSQSWTIAFSLSDRVGSFTEWYVIAPDGADSNRTENYADGGFTFLVNDDLQLDVRGGVGLNDAAVDYFVGAGFVLRH